MVLVIAVGAGLVMLRKQLGSETNSAEQRVARRADAIAARAQVAGSPLLCLDASAGRTVETACEALLFGRLETILAAVSYVGAKLELLSDAARTGVTLVDGRLTAIRNDLEADRFGIVAHVLTDNLGCNPDRCGVLDLLTDSQRVKTNMQEGTFDRLVARHKASWTSAGPAAETADAIEKNQAPELRRTIAKPLLQTYNFPSASSIPPISIYVPEPEDIGGEKAEPVERKPPTNVPAGSEVASSSLSAPPPHPAPRRSQSPGSLR